MFNILDKKVMSKKERLLRIAGIMIILRDELEELGQQAKWVEQADLYLEMLTAKSEEVNKEFNDLFWHLDSVIRDVDEPNKLIGELFKILKKDLIRVGVQHEINQHSQGVLFAFDPKKVKILDSKLRLV